MNSQPGSAIAMGTIRGAQLEVGEVRSLFGPVAIYANAYRYDVSADGQRFLVAPAFDPRRHSSSELASGAEEIGQWSDRAIDPRFASLPNLKFRVP